MASTLLPNRSEASGRRGPSTASSSAHESVFSAGDVRDTGNFEHDRMPLLGVPHSATGSQALLRRQSSHGSPDPSRTDVDLSNAVDELSLIFSDSATASAIEPISELSTTSCNSPRKPTTPCDMELVGEIWLQIFSFLDLPELCSCAKLAKPWADRQMLPGWAVASDVIWKPLCHRRWSKKAPRFRLDARGRETALRTMHPQADWKRICDLVELDGRRWELSESELNRLSWSSYPMELAQNALLQAPIVPWRCRQRVAFAVGQPRPFGAQVGAVYRAARLSTWEWLLMGRRAAFVSCRPPASLRSWMLDPLWMLDSAFVDSIFPENAGVLDVVSPATSSSDVSPNSARALNESPWRVLPRRRLAHEAPLSAPATLSLEALETLNRAPSVVLGSPPTTASLLT